VGRVVAALVPVTALVASLTTPTANAADDPSSTTATTVAAAEAEPVCPASAPAVAPTVAPVVPAASEPWNLSVDATPSWGTSKISGKSKAYKVSAIVEADGIAYLGGEFKKMTRGGSTQYRNYLAAINGATGELTSWNPKASGKVYALELSGDGKSVYVGGDFSYIGGKYTTKLAKVDLATGKIDPTFKPSVKERVRGLALAGDRLYVGGDFTTINGQPRPKLAALDPATGALLDWMPPVLGRGRHLGQTGIPTPDYEAGDVYAVEAIGGKVFAAGNFTNFGCQGGLVTIDAATGGLVEPQYDPGRPIFDLDTYDGILYAVGGGPGGRAYAFSPDKKTPLWKLKVDGDSMGVSASATAVYVAGHYDYVVSKDSSCWQFCPGGPRRHHILAVNRADGMLLAWNPDANTSTGPYTVTAGRNALYVGGEFTKINFKSQPGFTIFPGTP
jgi:outer membrane protein assembly factor BamB